MFTSEPSDTLVTVHSIGVIYLDLFSSVIVPSTSFNVRVGWIYMWLFYHFLYYFYTFKCSEMQSYYFISYMRTKVLNAIAKAININFLFLCYVNIKTMYRKYDSYNVAMFSL